MRFSTLLAASLLLPTMSLADVTMRFIEGAPKDRFVLTAGSDLCFDGPASVSIQLAGSAGALIFDVTETGAGVEVFQPFELVAGGDNLSAAPQVSDGDQSLTLLVDRFRAGTEIAFTIDVDDTINAREITVTNSEIEGASIQLVAGNETLSAPFGSSARATLDWNGCAG